MNWDMLKRRLAWAQMRTRILNGPPIEVPFEPLTLLADQLKEVATAHDEAQPTVVFDPPLRVPLHMDEDERPASGKAIEAKWRRNYRGPVLGPVEAFHKDLDEISAMLPSHPHIMHMTLDPANCRFVQGYNIENPKPKQCRFQYEGVNLYTNFIWDGTSVMYWMVKKKHMEETAKFLNRNGISTTIVRYDTDEMETTPKA